MSKWQNYCLENQDRTQKSRWLEHFTGRLFFLSPPRALKEGENCLALSPFCSFPVTRERCDSSVAASTLLRPGPGERLTLSRKLWSKTHPRPTPWRSFAKEGTKEREVGVWNHSSVHCAQKALEKNRSASECPRVNRDSKAAKELSYVVDISGYRLD